MKRRIVFTLVLLLLIFVANVVQGEEVLSRGEFAALLVEAGGMQCDLPPAELLVQKGIMKGYPDGELYLERGITRIEAVTLVAKTLGVTEIAAEPSESELLLDESHWGYAFYSWLNRFGLLDGDPEQLLTAEEAKAFLDSIFSSDSAAVPIMEDVQENMKTIKTMRFVFNGKMKMVPRPGVEGAEEIPQMDLRMRSIQEMVLPNSIHQETRIETEIPGEGEQELSTEMYLVNGKMYQKISLGPEANGTQWVRYPEELFPNLDDLLNVDEAAAVVPPGLEDYLYYRLLGRAEFNNSEVYKIATYGRVDDFGAFIEAFAGPLGDLQMQEFFAQAMTMIDSMSFWSIQYIGTDDYLTKSAEMFFIINYADEFAGRPNPIEALQMKMQVEEYSYNEDFEIVLPEEALEAPLMELPELPSPGDDGGR